MRTVAAAIALCAAACTPGASDSVHESVGSVADNAAAVGEPATGDAEDFEAKWGRLSRDARAEGQLVVIAGAGRSRDHRRIFEAFSERFGVDVITGTGRSSAVVQRVLAERSRGRFTADVSLVSPTTSERLRKAGALVPLAPQFVHPEVVDRSKGWLYDRYVWGDEAQAYTALFFASVRENLSNIFYNTSQVSTAEIESLRSWNDLLQPRWRGRVVVVLDPHAEDGTSHWVTAWQVLGRDWFERFFRDTRPVLLPENAVRELEDGLARGKYHLACFLMSVAERDLERMSSIAIPVRKLERTLAEGRSIHASGAIAMFDRAPHPHAARLFVNWYLSRDGQNTRHALIESEAPGPSLRTDVEQGRVTDSDWRIVRSADAHSIAKLRDPIESADARRESEDFVKALCSQIRCYGY